MSVSVTRDGAVATVTLGRPALDMAAKVALLENLRTVGDDASLRAVVLTGTGRTFCVGQDLAEHAAALSGSAATAFDTVDEHYAPVVRVLTTMPKPVVAAVNGTCVGAGLGLALACDLRVFSATAGLGTAFSGIGLTCDSGLSWSLVRAVGQARAAELVLVGSMFTVADAVAWGIAGTVVEPEAVLASAQELAQRLAAGPTLAYAESKALLRSAGSLEEALSAESAAQHRLGLTADHRNAVQAFLARERPSFEAR
jgi:2-(1,2-epoxy-1,2-dihydrophenyl)acetyl-CoA isomerase